MLKRMLAFANICFGCHQQPTTLFLNHHHHHHPQCPPLLLHIHPHQWPQQPTHNPGESPTHHSPCLLNTNLDSSTASNLEDEHSVPNTSPSPPHCHVTVVIDKQQQPWQQPCGPRWVPCTSPSSPSECQPRQQQHQQPQGWALSTQHQPIPTSLTHCHVTIVDELQQPWRQPQRAQASLPCHWQWLPRSHHHASQWAQAAPTMTTTQIPMPSHINCPLPIATSTTIWVPSAHRPGEPPLFPPLSPSEHQPGQDMSHTLTQPSNPSDDHPINHHCT